MKSVRRKENEDEVLSGIYMKYCSVQRDRAYYQGHKVRFGVPCSTLVGEIVEREAAPFFWLSVVKCVPCFHSVRGEREE